MNLDEGKQKLLAERIARVSKILELVAVQFDEISKFAKQHEDHEGAQKFGEMRDLISNEQHDLIVTWHCVLLQDYIKEITSDEYPAVQNAEEMEQEAASIVQDFLDRMTSQDDEENKNE